MTLVKPKPSLCLDIEDYLFRDIQGKQFNPKEWFFRSVGIDVVLYGFFFAVLSYASPVKSSTGVGGFEPPAF